RQLAEGANDKVPDEDSSRAEGGQETRVVEEADMQLEERLPEVSLLIQIGPISPSSSSSSDSAPSLAPRTTSHDSGPASDSRSYFEPSLGQLSAGHTPARLPLAPLPEHSPSMPPRYVTPTAEDRIHPGEGWYEFKPRQHISFITIPEDEHGPRMEAPFLKVEILSGDPTLLGTRGYGHPIYGVPLTALAFSTAPPEHHIGFPLYHFQNAFDQRINQAVDTLRDLGVAADVYRLRQIPHRQLEVKTMRRTVVGLEWAVQQMWHQITTAEVNIEHDE